MLASLYMVAAFIAFVVWNNLPSQIIAYDVLGYYAVLPLLFIYNDLTLANHEAFMAVVNHYEATDVLYQMVEIEPGRWVMKYPLGMAVFYAPFFFIGHLLAVLGPWPSDGFSPPYHYAMAAGSVLYSAVGIYLLSRVLHQYFKRGAALASLIVVLFGSNWLVTHGVSMMMPHIPLFASTAAVLWLTPKWLQSFHSKTGLALGFVLGLSALARPTEAWLAVIPLLWNVHSTSSLKTRIGLLFKRNIRATLKVSAMVLAFAAVQLMYWKWATGSWLYTEYGNSGEEMDWLTPHTIDFLFSFRKGWFIYTPIMIPVILGFIPLWKHSRELFWAALVFIAGSIYLASSWSTWWYAASFSQRPMVQVLPVLALPAAAGWSIIQRSKRTVRGIIVSAIALLVLFNLFQSWQFVRGILPADRMTKAYYSAIFLRTQIPEGAKKLLLIDRVKPYDVHHMPADGYRAIEPIIMPVDNGSGDPMANPVWLPPECEYAGSVSISYDHITASDHAFLVLEGEVYVEDPDVLAQVFVIMTLTKNGKSYGYRGEPLNRLVKTPAEAERWLPLQFTYLTPEIRNNSDMVTLYLWQPTPVRIALRRFKVTPWAAINHREDALIFDPQ